MAVIRPFQCIHPAKELVAQVAALPYDVYDREEARAEALAHPLSFLNIDCPETQFPERQDPYAPEVYQKAHDLLWERIENGIFVKETQACYYLYELTMNGRAQTGIVACASIDDYQSGVIKKHENTRAEKEQDRIRHVDCCSVQTGPIFLAYRREQVIQDTVQEVKKELPFFDFVSEDGIRHRGWQISGSAEMEKIQSAFDGISQIYIADGHHRAASAVKVGLKRREACPGYTGEEEFNYFLSVLFPDDELLIMDYNRVVKDLNGLTQQEFLEAIAEKWFVEKEEAPAVPKQKGQVGMYLKDQWYRLTAKPQIQKEDPVEGLDVSLLQRELLQPVLGIENPKTDTRIDFVGGIRGMQELERRVHTDCAAAFAMYPTSIAELFDVADAGMLMPPKSTWFEPKLRSGIFLHAL